MVDDINSTQQHQEVNMIPVARKQLIATRVAGVGLLLALGFSSSGFASQASAAAARPSTGTHRTVSCNIKPARVGEHARQRVLKAHSRPSAVPKPKTRSKLKCKVTVKRRIAVAARGQVIYG